ncbi:hypothetical protein PoB_005353900 [Plakobranchus ocellatus]|uniref:Uncharacterized protein n=1 Tax=Plakobranchus ocellatus TaxID=259542 RepID=A0AAV4C3C8_9GAST|nr:hypothetical protein PoB_005353900 [Plakobranchus ocellatus]
MRATSHPICLFHAIGTSAPSCPPCYFFDGGNSAISHPFCHFPATGTSTPDVPSATSLMEETSLQEEPATPTFPFAWPKNHWLQPPPSGSDVTIWPLPSTTPSRHPAPMSKCF